MLCIVRTRLRALRAFFIWLCVDSLGVYAGAGCITIGRSINRREPLELLPIRAIASRHFVRRGFSAGLGCCDRSSKLQFSGCSHCCDIVTFLQPREPSLYTGAFCDSELILKPAHPVKSPGSFDDFAVALFVASPSFDGAGPQSQLFRQS